MVDIMVSVHEREKASTGKGDKRSSSKGKKVDKSASVTKPPATPRTTNISLVTTLTSSTVNSIDMDLTVGGGTIASDPNNNIPTSSASNTNESTALMSGMTLIMQNFAKTMGDKLDTMSTTFGNLTRNLTQAPPQAQHDITDTCMEVDEGNFIDPEYYLEEETYDYDLEQDEQYRSNEPIAKRQKTHNISTDSIDQLLNCGQKIGSPANAA